MEGILIKPKVWANRLSTVWRMHTGANKIERFPINVSEIISDMVNNLFPDEPIIKIKSLKGSTFDGVLARGKTREWYIIYNSNIREHGRINFTIAHELRHYLCHRKRQQKLEYSNRDILDTGSTISVNIEKEANDFASYLLMPIDDYR